MPRSMHWAFLKPVFLGEGRFLCPVKNVIVMLFLQVGLKKTYSFAVSL